MTKPAPRFALAFLVLTLLAAPVAAREVDAYAAYMPLPIALPSSQQDGSNWDASRWDGSRWDASRWDGSTWDGSTWDGSTWDASRWDASRWDGSTWDASNWDALEWDASRWDTAAFAGFDPLYKYQWGLRASRVTDAWAIMGPGDGSRIICVVDSGVDHTHPDLRARMWEDAHGRHGYDFVDDDPDPMDVGGHGTHVASIAAGAAGDAHGVAGVANAQIMAVRVLGPDGSGTDEDLIAGIVWCVDHGAHIVSLSLSTVEDVKVIGNAVDYAATRGALVVGSAGNQQCLACQGPLVKMRGVLTVAAVDPTGQVARFASWGPNVDLGAPGVAIPGAMPGGGFAIASGSSQAVPHVSGAAALVWQRNPALTAGEVADVLRQSAQRTGETAYGPLRVLDVDAAVRIAPGFELTDADGAAGVSDGGATVDPGATRPPAPAKVLSNAPVSTSSPVPGPI